MFREFNRFRLAVCSLLIMLIPSSALAYNAADEVCGYVGGVDDEGVSQFASYDGDISTALPDSGRVDFRIGGWVIEDITEDLSYDRLDGGAEISSDDQLCVDFNGDIYDENRWAWNTNVGWIDFGWCEDASCVDDAFRIDLGLDGDLASTGDAYWYGYAWNDTIGWIDFSWSCTDCDETERVHTTLPEDWPNMGELDETISGEISGFGWNDRIGWIRFGNPEDATYAPMQDLPFIEADTIYAEAVVSIYPDPSALTQHGVGSGSDGAAPYADGVEAYEISVQLVDQDTGLALSNDYEVSLSLDMTEDSHVYLDQVSQTGDAIIWDNTGYDEDVDSTIFTVASLAPTSDMNGYDEDGDGYIDYYFDVDSDTGSSTSSENRYAVESMDLVISGPSIVELTNDSEVLFGLSADQVDFKFSPAIEILVLARETGEGELVNYFDLELDEEIELEGIVSVWSDEFLGASFDVTSSLSTDSYLYLFDTDLDGSYLEDSDDASITSTFGISSDDSSHLANFDAAYDYEIPSVDTAAGYSNLNAGSAGDSNRFAMLIEEGSEEMAFSPFMVSMFNVDLLKPMVDDIPFVEFYRATVLTVPSLFNGGLFLNLDLKGSLGQARFDVSEESDGESDVLAVVTTTADLTVVDVYLDDDYQIMADVSNIGAEDLDLDAVGGSSITAFLYIDDVYSSGGNLMNLEDESFAIMDGVSTYSYAWLGSLEGSHEVHVCLDSYNVVDESDESNNCSEMVTLDGMEEVELLPDFTIGDITVTEGGGTVYAELMNIGEASVSSDAGGHTLFYVDDMDNPVTGYAWSSVAEANTGFLDAGGTSTWGVISIDESSRVKVCIDPYDAVEESDETNNCTDVMLEIEYPDFEVSYIELNTDNDLVISISNNGAADATTSGTDPVLALYEDGVKTTSVTWSAFDDSNFLVSGGLTEYTVAASEGSYTFSACIDGNEVIDEEDETNNCYDLAVAVGSTALPDFTIGSITVTEGGGTVYAELMNIGEAGVSSDAGGHTHFYVDDMDTAVIGYGWSSVAEANTGFLDAGGSSTWGVISIEESSTVKVCIDTHDAIEESDETNNCLEQYIEVIDALPDLEVVEVYLDEDSYVMVDVANVGTAEVDLDAVGGSAVTAYLYIDGVYFAPGDLMDLSDESFAEIDGVSTVDYEFWGALDGTYEAYVCLDTFEVVTELNESNNCSDPVTLTSVSLPDLTVGEIALQDPEGGTIDVELMNLGVVDVDPDSAGVIYFYVGDMDSPVASYSWSGLAEQGFLVAESSATLGVIDTDESTTVRVCIDWDDVIVESDETNNCVDEDIEIASSEEADLPDLTIPAITINDDYDFVISVLNDGAGDVSTIGTNPVIAFYEDDVKQRSVTWSALDDASFLTSGGYTEVLAPASEGTYTFKACIDDNEVIEEEDETNNCLELEAVVTYEYPDFVVTDISYPDDYTRGSNIEFTVENQSGTFDDFESLNASDTGVAVYVDGGLEGLMYWSDFEGTPEYEAVFEASSSVTIPVSVTYGAILGDHTVEVCFDIDDYIEEAGDENNCYEVDLVDEVDSAGSDLEITQVYEDSGSYFYDIVNNGPADIDVFDLTTSARTIVYSDSSSGATVETNIYNDYVSTDEIEFLEAGITQSIEIDWSGDASTIYVCADAWDEIIEVDENNNCALYSVTSTPTTYSDLTISNLYTHPSSDEIIVLLENIGERDVTGTDDGPYLTVYVDGAETGSYHWSALDSTTFMTAGYSSFETFQAVTGDHTIYACLDEEDSITESDETNNCMTYDVGEGFSSGMSYETEISYEVTVDGTPYDVRYYSFQLPLDEGLDGEDEVEPEEETEPEIPVEIETYIPATGLGIPAYDYKLDSVVLGTITSTTGEDTGLVDSTGVSEGEIDVLSDLGTTSIRNVLHKRFVDLTRGVGSPGGGEIGDDLEPYWADFDDGEYLLKYRDDAGNNKYGLVYFDDDVHITAVDDEYAQKTIVVEGGDVFLDTNLSGYNTLGIVVLKDSNGEGGNLYIHGDVTTLEKLNVYVDGSVLSYVGDTDEEIEDYLDQDGYDGRSNELMNWDEIGSLSWMESRYVVLGNQLYWSGSLISSNTIGGVLDETTGVDPAGDAVSSIVAIEYDLHYLRHFVPCWIEVDGDGIPVDTDGDGDYLDGDLPDYQDDLEECDSFERSISDDVIRPNDGGDGADIVLLEDADNEPFILNYIPPPTNLPLLGEVKGESLSIR
jgi:subtilase family serine protease